MLTTITSFICYNLKPICLTMWDQFVDNESAAISDIIAPRLKVVSHNGMISWDMINLFNGISIFIIGMSLSMKQSSSFIINPNKDVIEIGAIAELDKMVRLFLPCKLIAP